MNPKMNALSHYKTKKVSQSCWVSLLLCPVLAHAGPQGAQVVSGQAVVIQSSQGGQSVTTVTQTSNKATLNWQQFNVGPTEIVKFVQPGASSVAINRISDPNGSRIQGKLSANGQVWLINPAGVYFGPGAQVNVGGLVASTLNLADNTKPAQLQGAVSAGNNKASVVNEGRIQTAEGGYAALMAGNVSNPGNITSPGGRILLLGDKQNGSVSLSGRLDTSSAVSNTPGFIETSAAVVRIADTARVYARAADGSSGEWLIDPTDFTISSGSSASTSSGIGATTLSTSLDSTNVIIATDDTSGSDSGNIYVNSDVSWSAATLLTLSAYKDIYINAPITSSNSSGKLKLMYGQGSTSGSISGVVSDYYVNAPVTLAAGTNLYTQLGSDTTNLKSYQVITGLGSSGSTTASDLQGMNGDLTANYALGADIDASGTTSWLTSTYVKGFTKIGNNTTSADYYSGTFAGLGHVISDLYLYRPLVGVSGLFAVLSSDAVLRDTGMVNMAITTNSSGGLVGRNYGSIKNSFTTGSITSQAGFVGGLAGDNGDTGTITNSYSTATVTATTDIPAGGLIGRNYGSVVNSYASGSVSGTSGYTGGLIGNLMAIGSVTDSIWNTQTSGQSSGAGINSATSGNDDFTGLIPAEMKLVSNFSNWDFTTPWIIYSSYTEPLLRAFMTPLTISAYAYGTKVYDGTTTTTAASYTDPGSLSKTFSGSISFALDGADVGAHSVVASGFYSDQLGYQISYSFSTNSVTVTSSASSSTTAVPSITNTDISSTASTSTTPTSTATTSTASTSSGIAPASANSSSATSTAPTSTASTVSGSASTTTSTTVTATAVGNSTTATVTLLTPVIESDTTSAPANETVSNTNTEISSAASDKCDDSNNQSVTTYTAINTDSQEEQTHASDTQISGHSNTCDSTNVNTTGNTASTQFYPGYASANADQVTAQKQSQLTLPSISDKLPGGRTVEKNAELPAGLNHAWNAEFSVNNHGSSYTGETQTSLRQQHTQLLSNGDSLDLNLLASSGNMQYGRWSYEMPMRQDGWRVGATSAYLKYKLGGSAASLDAYGNARQNSVWADQLLFNNRQTQWNWRTQYDRIALQDVEEASSTNNDRLLQVWHLGASGARADSVGGGRTWLNLDLLWSYLRFNDTTAQTTDASAAETQGHSNRLTLSAGRLQPLGDNTQLMLNWQAQWANQNLDTTQKMSFGGAHNVRAYAPGVLSGDAGHLLTAEIKHRLTPTGKAVTISGDLYASVFVDAGWLTLYQNPYASGSNQARLAGAGVGLSWEGPRYWRASFSVSQPIGNAPSQLSGSSYLHANAWLELSKGFR